MLGEKTGFSPRYFKKPIHQKRDTFGSKSPAKVSGDYLKLKNCR